MTHVHRRDRGPANFLGVVPAGFKPVRDRKVRVKTVPCPTCHVPVDVGCITTDSNPMNGHHVARRRMAVRAMNNARG